MAVGNFTPEDIKWEHQGISGVIKSGEVVADRDRGWENHVLNKWGPRGLVRLDYGADEKQAKKQSKALYQAFWERQISDFNEHNSQLKNEGKMYVRPSAQLKEHAEELGVELVGPWTLKRTSEDAGIDRIPPAKDENSSRVDALEQRVGGIESQLGDIAGMLKEVVGNMGAGAAKQATILDGEESKGDGGSSRSGKKS